MKARPKGELPFPHRVLYEIGACVILIPGIKKGLEVPVSVLHALRRNEKLNVALIPSESSPKTGSVHSPERGFIPVQK